MAKKSDAKVVRWLKGYRQRRVLLFWLGSIGCFLLSFPVLAVTWGAIWLTLLIPFIVLGHLSAEALGIATWVALGLLFVAHVTSNRAHLESLRFDEPSPGMVAAQFAAHVAGMSSLSLMMTGPETMRSQVKMISLLLLSGPALLGLSWRMAKAAVAAQRMDVTLVGAALARLLAADERVSVDGLAKKVDSLNPPLLLRELLLIEGVVLLTTGDPSLTLTDSLRKEIASGLESLNESD